MSIKKLAGSVPAAAALAFTLASAPVATAQDYPSKAIELMVPAGAGGSTDTLGRILADGLSKELGQQVIVLNKNGASGRIGTKEVLSKEADGYTVEMVWSAILTLNESLFAEPGYNAVEDFDMIAGFATVPNFLVVHPDVPANSIEELIALAKSKPGELNYASSNPGSMSRLSMDLFNQMAGTDIVHVPFSGDAEVMPAIVGGHIEVTITNTVAGLPMVQEGKLRPLAVTMAKRSVLLPDLPTMDEAGVPGYATDLWYGLVAKKGTPEDIVNKLSAAVEAVLKTDEVQKALADRGAEPFYMAPGEMLEKVKKDRETLGGVVKAAGIEKS
ncbi:hypothetical protein ATO6_13275 [Oceanicola sp. 22II-s10i]|uniref:Bug family tripartite tricarboxylate transporter substrate binding protein n=1 Tax=Oceanicola sp. 22II-s10i TaxID=1317116 RepID=UPI000B714D47|nr:tripartite tricarboxylate transporter substrate binding protein [Oceanicola sp. 22II-s10i]OWU84623.1 hypothetical protein ATO6_13275 [Oceanicola sp. 22II-s10i]